MKEKGHNPLVVPCLTIRTVS